LPERLFDVSRHLLAREADGTAFRLIGIGAAPILGLQHADPVDLADPLLHRRVRGQSAIDALRARFGRDAVRRGREFG
jgi:DNA polymerase-4